MSKLIGLDVGTSNIRMYVKGKGIILRSPTVVAVDTSESEIVAIGKDAKKMIGKTPPNIVACRPVTGGVVADYEATALMLHEYFNRTGVISFLNRPIVLASIPANCSEVEKNALENAIFEAGAKAVGLVRSPLACAIGAGQMIASARGSMIVSIGGGVTQIAVISSGGIVRSKAIKLAGDKLDQAVINYLYRKYGLTIGELTAELLKVKIGSAVSDMKRGVLEVSGRNEVQKCAQTIRINSDDVRLALKNPLEQVCRSINIILEKVPPEIAGDISDYGITLVGGGASIFGIGRLITNKTGLRVNSVQVPMDCECLGIGKIIEHPNTYPDGVLFKRR